MRRIVRTVAAGFVVILGLALVSVAAFSSDVVNVTRPDAPKTSDAGSVAPLSPPDPDNLPVRNIPGDMPDIFATEFGKRGAHEVNVSMRGQGYYQVHWRGGKVDDGLGNYSQTKTVRGGFPLVLIVVNGLGRSVGCSVTIDGVEKDTKSSSAEQPIIYCSG
jgi:hypothetical protein